MTAERRECSPSTWVIGLPGPLPGPAPVPDAPQAALLSVLREDLLYGPTAPAVAVLLTFSLLVVTLALYVGLCVAIFAIS